MVGAALDCETTDLDGAIIVLARLPVTVPGLPGLDGADRRARAAHARTLRDAVAGQAPDQLRMVALVCH